MNEFPVEQKIPIGNETAGNWRWVRTQTSLKKLMKLTERIESKWSRRKPVKRMNAMNIVSVEGPYVSTAREWKRFRKSQERHSGHIMRRYFWPKVCLLTVVSMMRSCANQLWKLTAEKVSHRFAFTVEISSTWISWHLTRNIERSLTSAHYPTLWNQKQHTLSWLHLSILCIDKVKQKDIHRIVVIAWAMVLMRLGYRMREAKIFE